MAKKPSKLVAARLRAAAKNKEAAQAVVPRLYWGMGQQVMAKKPKPLRK
jgi:hypothetical protein